MFTESYHKASADFKAWLDYNYPTVLSPFARGVIASQHATRMEAALSQNAETASTLKAAQLEIKTLRDRLDDAERRAHRAESDLIIFQGSVDASHRFLNEYLGTPESDDHGPVTSRIKALLEAKDKLAAGQDDRIIELEKTEVDLKASSLSKYEHKRLQILERAMFDVDELLTKHGVSRDGYVTQKIERLIAYKDKLIADADAQVRSADSQRYMAEATLRTSIGDLRNFISSPDVNTSDLPAMIKHVKWIISETHDAIRAAGLAFVDICGTQIIVNHGLPADRIRELVSETLAKAADAKRSGLLEQSEAWVACVNQLRLGNPNYNSASGSGLERAVNEIQRLQAAAADQVGLRVTWESIFDTLSDGNPKTFLQDGTGRANALAEIKRLQEAAALAEGNASKAGCWDAVAAQLVAANGRTFVSPGLSILPAKDLALTEIKRLQTAAVFGGVLRVDFESYRDPLRVAYETSPFGAAAATSIAADNELEDQKRETAKWKRAARALASGLASIKRVLDSIAPFPLDSFEDGVAPVSASLVDRIRALAKDRDILKSMEAANRTFAKELETAHQARLTQQQQIFSAKIREAHAMLDKSEFLQPLNLAHRSLRERIESLVSWSNLYVSK